MLLNTYFKQTGKLQGPEIPVYMLTVQLIPIDNAGHDTKELDISEILYSGRYGNDHVMFLCGCEKK